MTIKILNVIGTLGYGGAELQTIEVSKRLLERGHEVTLLVLGKCHPVLKETCLTHGMQVQGLKAAPLSPINFFRICSVIRAGDYDVIHAHLFPALYFTALCKGCSSKPAKFIYTEHSTSNNRRKISWMRHIEKIIYSAFDEIVCVSDAARDELKKWAPYTGKIRVIYNGIDYHRFADARADDRANFGLHADDIIVLSVGALRHEKNQAVLIEAMNYLPAGYRLVLVGDGPMHGLLHTMADKYGLQKRVLFAGEMANIERIMKMSDVYVLPSLFEGFGLSAVEAAAAGLPVVYSNVPGLGSIFKSAGIPVDATHPEQIAQAILDATSSGTRRQELCKASVQTARCYDIGTTAEQYEALYAAKL